MSTDNNDFIARHQVGIPGLSLLFQPQALARRLALHCAVEPDQLSLTPRYIRFKPDSSCLVAYEATWQGQRFPCTAKALALHNAMKLEKLQERASSDGPLGPGRVLFPERLVAVSFFPNDKALRGLRHYLSHHPDMRTLAYKPERRYVGLLEHDDGRREVVKLYKRTAFETARKLALAADEIGLLPNLVRVDVRRCAIHFEWADGEPLTSAILRGDGVRACEEAARLIARLHAMTPPRALSTGRPEEPMLRLRALTDDLVALCPECRSTAEKIHHGLRAALRALPAATALVHGDFYANQVLLSNDGHRLLDVDALQIGHPESDLGLFLAHLRLDVQRHRLTAGSADLLGQAFVGAYREQGAVDEELLRIYTLYAMFQLSHRPFRDQLPTWSALTRQWLDHIAEGVAGLQTTRVSAIVDRPRSTDPGGAPSAQGLLGAAMDPRIGYRLVEQSLQEIGPAYANARVVGGEVLRHKPGRRALLRYTVRRQANAPEVAVIGKIRDKGLDWQTLGLNRHLHADCARHPDLPLRVPLPVAAIPSLSMWLQAWVDGRDGWSLLADRDAIRHADAIATALHQLHQSRAPIRKHHSLQDELAILAKRLAAAAATSPMLATRVRRLESDCNELGAKQGPRPLCTAHRDFYPDQLLERKGKVYLLDLDLACNADPAIDLGNYVAHVQERDLRRYGEPRRHAAFCERFVATYAALAGDSGLEDAVEIYRVLTLARHVDISTRFDERSAFTEDILAFCESEIGRLLRVGAPRNAPVSRPV